MKKIGRRKETWDGVTYVISQKFLDVRGDSHEIKGVAVFNESEPRRLSKEVGRDIAEKKYFLNLFKFKLKEDLAEYKIMKNFATQILSMNIKGSVSTPADNIQYQIKRGGEDGIKISKEVMKDPAFKYRNRIVEQLQHKQYDIARDKDLIKSSERALKDCLIMVDVIASKKEEKKYAKTEYDSDTLKDAEDLINTLLGDVNNG